MQITKIQETIKNDDGIFLKYRGIISQSLITAMTEVLEPETTNSDLNMGDANNIYTIFIELSQNMMNYSKDKEKNEIRPEGLILVGKDDDLNYYIYSQNIVTLEDKNKIESKLVEISAMNIDEIKKRYKELRRSGKGTHKKGGGIGFYEIAKRCASIDYRFTKIDENRYYFHFQATIK